jgi:hypothetical protein
VKATGETSPLFGPTRETKFDITSVRSSELVRCAVLASVRHKRCFDAFLDAILQKIKNILNFMGVPLGTFTSGGGSGNASVPQQN